MENKLKIAIKSFFLFIAILATFGSEVKAATLNQGDIAVIGMNEFTDKVTIVTLVSIPQSTIIKITDYGWDVAINAFNTGSPGDGIITWTTSSIIPAGTILELFLNGNGGNSTLTNLSNGANLTSSIAVAGWPNANNTILANGDQIFIYQDADSNPFFIFGLNNSAITPLDANNWNTTFATNSNVVSFLPNGTGSQNALTNGVNAIGLPSGTNQQDNVQYTGPTTAANKATWLSRIANLANWGGDSTDPSTLVNTISSPTNPTITVSSALSNNADLSALSLSSGTLAPAFAPGINSYNASVSNATTSITVTPTRAEANATITVNGAAVTSGNASGALALAVGANTITTIVTAQDGTTTKTYTVTVTRAASANADLANLTLSSGTLVTAFAASTTSYTASVSNATTSITVTPTRAEPNATIKVNGAAVTSGNASGAIALAVGVNTITTVVTAQNGATKTYTVTVARLSNFAPTDLTLSSTSINENVAANSQIGSFSTTDVDAGNSFTYSFVAGGADNGSFTISGNSLTINSIPNFESKSSYAITIRTTDQGNLFFDKAFSITVNNVNETPTGLALSATSINENVAANSTVGSLSTTDPDASNTFIYTLVAGIGGDNNASFSISGDELRINNSPNFETTPSFSVRIRTTDQGGLTREQAFTITVNNVNETPTDLALSATSVNENVAANSTVGTLSTTDPDASNTFTYTLVAGTGGDNNASFSISGDELRINNSPNFETTPSFSVRIRTIDQGGLFREDSFTIMVNNVNESPTITNAIPNQNATEAQAFNFTFAANTFDDVDAGTTLTYTAQLAGGSALPTWLSFNGATRTFSGTPLNANVGSVSIDVIANDGSGGAVTDVFTITVANVNDAPTVANAIANQNATEDQAFFFQFAANTFTDVDVITTFTYTAQLAGGGALPSWLSFTAATRTFSGIPLNANVGTVSIDVIANDGNGGTVTDAFNISVANVNDVPTDLALSATSINENVAANSQIGSFSTTDPDFGNTFTYSFVAGGVDNGSFTISGNSLTINSIPNVEAKSSYALTIRTTDQGNLFFDKAFTITVNNVNETPTDIALSATSVNENVESSTTVGTLSTTDPDAGNTFNYTLVAGTGDINNALFNISGNELRINNGPDFETTPSLSVRIRTMDQGSLIREEAFTIAVNNVNESPTIANAIPNQNAIENQSFNFQFAANTFADVDAGTTFTYTTQLAGGGSLPIWLSFDGATRTFSGTPLNANVGSISIDVIASDGSGGELTDVFTITVANVNDAPTVANAIPNQNATEGQVFFFQFAANTFTDVDVITTFTYTAQLAGGVALPTWLSFDGATGTFSGTPLNGDVASISIEVIASDGNGGSVTDNFNLTVTNVNDAPIVANAIPNQIATENQAFNFTFEANTFADVDAITTFTYTAQLAGGGALPTWLSFDGATGTFSGTPLNANVGSVSIGVIANDGSGGAVTDVFTITVANVNDAPTVANAIANQNATEDQAFFFQFPANTFADVDEGTTFTYTAQLNGGGDLPVWLSFNGATRTFSGSPLNANVGSVIIEVIANDGNGGIVTNEFTITVTNVNDVPTVVNAIPNQNATEDQVFNFQFAANTFEDVDAGTILTYTAQLNNGGALPAWLDFNGATRTFSGIPLNTNVGTINIDVIANDGNGGTVSDNFNIVIEATQRVGLKEFSANPQIDGTVLLAWDTFSKQNIDYFEISRSTFGISFDILDSLKVSTTKSGLYNLLDSIPKDGVNFYKLVQVDLNGTKKELGIRSAWLTLANEAKVMIYPNPSTDVVKVVFEPGIYRYAYLLDLNGKILLTKTIAFKEDGFSFNLSKLSPSTYVIKLYDTSKAYSHKIIVK